VVAEYASRNNWICRDDLTQEAYVASLEASRTWRPEGGKTRERWEAYLVALALSRFVAEQRSPVSLPKRKDESWHAAASMRRESLTMPRGSDESPEVAAVAADQHEPLEDFVDLDRAVKRLRLVLDGQSEVAWSVLLGEEKSSSVAKRTGVPTRDVYDQTRRAIVALRSAFCDQRADR
jgi:DNA-directed RNA polymerase specialized sigma24 family protein